MLASSFFKKRFAAAFRKAFQNRKPVLPKYLAVNDDAFISFDDATPGDLEQAREHERRNAAKHLKAAIDCMMRANLAHIMFNRKMSQEPFDGLPFEPETNQ